MLRTILLFYLPLISNKKHCLYFRCGLGSDIPVNCYVYKVDLFEAPVSTKVLNCRLSGEVS